MKITGKFKDFDTWEKHNESRKFILEDLENGCTIYAKWSHYNKAYICNIEQWYNEYDDEAGVLLTDSDLKNTSIIETYLTTKEED